MFKRHFSPLMWKLLSVMSSRNNDQSYFAHWLEGLDLFNRRISLFNGMFLFHLLVGQDQDPGSVPTENTAPVRGRHGGTGATLAPTPALSATLRLPIAEAGGGLTPGALCPTGADIMAAELVLPI